MTRILVTGGAGYVGAVSVEAFLAAGHDVVVLDDLSTGHRSAVPDGARLIVGDYGDQMTAAAVFAEESIDAILHCAARSLVGESLQEPARYFRDNVAGGIALLEAARSAGVSRFVLSSTAAVYGVPEETPIPEDAPLRPINPYGETKRSVEGVLSWYGRAYDFRSVSLRYFNVAGATDAIGEDHDPETHLIPAILGAAEAGRPVTIFGDDYPTRDGTNVRDYIHVADLAEAHLRAIDATAPGDARITDGFLVCNLGNGGGFTNLEVIEAAERAVGRSIAYEVGPRRAGDPPTLVASAGRAAEILGWHPQRATLDEIVGSAWAWRQGHPGGYPD
ncbi:MAG TPA: UDP-glucose 4-epimerase GalE [Candidatus Limnocylindrales bacterium]|nr:UDP-glucose 4-epimerase GalE [Candidatus Limnocylindrales bacterium]